MIAIRSTFRTDGNIFRKGMFAQDANRSFDRRRQLQRRALSLADAICRLLINFQRLIRARSHGSILRFFMALRGMLSTTDNIMIILTSRIQVRLTQDQIR